MAVWLHSAIGFATALTLLLIGSCASKQVHVPPSSPEKKPSKVLLISIDGLRPEFYQSDDWDAPTLKALARSGAYAVFATPIFPAVTYPNHTTIATGVSSARHGVLSNTVYDSQKGLTGLWYWEESYVKAPTLWQVAKASGRTVAILRWPASVGADVDWMVPEIFSAVGIHKETDWQRITQHFNPKLLSEVQADAPLKQIGSIDQVDPWNTYAAEFILKKYHPDFAMAHLINVDFVQHLTGRDSAETKKAVKVIDEQLQRILNATDLANTTVVVVGDHGFIDYTKVLNLNRLFADKGWIKTDKEKIVSWQALAHPDGGQAAIYVKKKALASKVLAALKEFAPGHFKILLSGALKQMKAYPDAIAAVVAEDGFIIGASAGADLIVTSAKTKAHHGQLPSHPKMKTGFIAAGPGIKPGLRIENINLIDVAPTVARLMGLSMKSAEGKAIDLSH